MCGICGKISLGASSDVSENLIRRMCGVLKHRGPDDEGVYIYPSPYPSPRRGEGIKVGLGHRRLSIIDLSRAGHQPMTNEDETIRIVLNGEIYNFLDLKADLEKKGHKFRSHTDTEVILHLYEERGVDCIKALRGMFAFAIWDEKKEILFLARDRIGKKPLFYSYKNDTLMFASELRALLQNTEISRDIGLASIDDFLNYQYIPAPFTVFKAVMKLPPAHFLKWEKGEIKIERYWEIKYTDKLKLKEEEYCEAILDLLKECTKIRLISDVPLGAFLSGGVDSSAIVAMMAQLMDRPVKTFSIGFERESFNETPYSRVIAERFGTEHREFIIKPNALEVLPELISHFGEPYGDSSAIPTYYLAKMTRQDVTVALNGDAGDESFGGYERYIANKLIQRYQKPVSVFTKLFGKVINNIPETTNKKDTVNRLKRFLNSAGSDENAGYAGLMAIFNERERKGLYSDHIRHEIETNRHKNIISDNLKNSDTADLIDSMLFTDLMTYMPGDLLPKVDITSMANSLEARSPFLDHKFLEFTARIPSGLKIKGFTTKYILRKALKKILPVNILKREKMGFGVPVGEWLKNDLKAYAYEVLLDSKSAKRGYFKTEKVRELLDNHMAEKINNGGKIWVLLNLELWHRMFIDNCIG